MKKILAVILTLAMVLCFAGCGAANTVKFSVSDLEGNVVHEFEVEAAEGDMAGDLLEKGLEEIGVEHEIIDDTMVQSIGDLEQDSVNWTVYWSVYVNGEYGQLGLWQQPVVAGDVIDIKLEQYVAE